MECALGWPEGLRLLVGAGYSPIGALQLAIFRHDVDSVAQMLSADSPTFMDKHSVQYHEPAVRFRFRKNNLLKAVLCSHCVSTLRLSNCVPRDRRLCCALAYGRMETDSPARHDIRNLVVAAIKDRRVRLASLALQYLPPERLSELHVGPGTPLDSRAFATYTALQDYGISVPEALYPGERPLLFSFNLSCELGGFPLVQALFDHGVCELDASPCEGITPLVQLFKVPLADGQKETMIRWFLERGANPNFSSDTMLPKFLFYLASVYDSPAIYLKDPLFPVALHNSAEWDGGRRARSIVPIEVADLVAAKYARATTSGMISLVARFCNPAQRDSCRCACSSGGCLPLHKFKNGIALEETSEGTWTSTRYGRIPKRWTAVLDTIQSWIQDCHLDDHQEREYLRDACRLEVFTRLGMAHTCCLFEVHDTTLGFPTRQQRDPETCRELEDEDTELREQLEAIMTAYDRALDTHRGTANDFWEWWWMTLEPLLPEIPAEQRRRMYGDGEIHQLDSSYTFEVPLMLFPTGSWGYSYIYDERDEDVTDGVRDAAGMDFIDEIKQYFAEIFSRDSFIRGETGIREQGAETLDG